jgi:hypothetical protein
MVNAMIDRNAERIKMLVSHDFESLELLGCQDMETAVYLYQDKMPNDCIVGEWVILVWNHVIIKVFRKP